MGEKVFVRIFSSLALSSFSPASLPRDFIEKKPLETQRDFWANITPFYESLEGKY